MSELWRLPFQRIEACAFPVYHQNLPEESLFYTPGYLVAVRSEFADEFSNQLCTNQAVLRSASYLCEYGNAAMLRWETQFGENPFTPLCLTLYTSQRCNLNCSYCFSQGEILQAEADLDLDYVLAAAKVVIANCKNANVPFTLVIHGGGEPTQDSRLPQMVSAIQEMVSRYEIGWFRYLATNGVMPEKTLQWAVQTFDEIGLSCDGPAEIQAIQRPLKNGQNSSPWVEKAAAAIREAGKPLHIRATISPQNMTRMPEMAEYFFGILGADEVRVEPVFGEGRSSHEMSIGQEFAEDYCTAFLQAKEIANSYRKAWLSTGSRPGEIHGRYCQVFRNVLHLVPGDGISACFKVIGKRQAKTLGMDIRDEDHARFAVDDEQVKTLRSVLMIEDPACQKCVNQYHCARGCPDRCPADPVFTGVDSLRCRVNLLLTTALLQKQAEYLKPFLKNLPAAGCAINGELL